MVPTACSLFEMNMIFSWSLPRWEDKWSPFTLKWKIAHFPTQKKKSELRMIQSDSIEFFLFLGPHPLAPVVKHITYSKIARPDFIWNIYIRS